MTSYAQIWAVTLYLVPVKVGWLVGRLVAPDRTTVTISDSVELRTATVIPSSESVLSVAERERKEDLGN